MPVPALISASYKTDIPAFYGRWFQERLHQGWAESVNPWTGKPFTIDLRAEAVGGFVFWTRNIEPFETVLPEVADRGAPFYIQFTILGYPHALDRSVIAPERAVAAFHRLAQRWGPLAVVWRYDPIILSSLTPSAWHEENFARLAEALRGATTEVVVSFAQVYRKTARNMADAAEQHGFSWFDPIEDDKKALLHRLVGHATQNDMRLALCAQRSLLVPGVEDARCIDAARLSKISGHPVPAARKPHRQSCGCFQSKDIGAYGTCPHGCAYCYAVEHPERAKALYQSHNERAPRLGVPSSPIVGSP